MTARAGRARLMRISEATRSSLVLIPGLLAILAAALASATITLDAYLVEAPALAWLRAHTGPPGALQTLTAIAGAIMTVGGVTFSITVVVLQLASSQYSPRVVRTFLRDRFIQAVIGTYLATFLYALLVLRTIRVGEEGGRGFVPVLSVSTAVVFTVVAILLLIGFLHHVAHGIQVPAIVQAIARETLDALDAAERPDGTACAPPTGLEVASDLGEVRAPTAGYVEYVDCRALGAVRGLQRVVIRVAVGAFVREGDLLATYGPPSPGGEQAILGSFSLHRERSTRQDVGFGLRMIADIAVRALSPGVNDPTTAVYCLDAASDLLARLAALPDPPETRRYGDVVVTQPRPGFAELLGVTLSQPTDYGREDPTVARAVLGALVAAADRDPTGRHGAAVRAQLERVAERVGDAGWLPVERDAFLAEVAEARRRTR